MSERSTGLKPKLTPRALRGPRLEGLLFHGSARIVCCIQKQGWRDAGAAPALHAPKTPGEVKTCTDRSDHPIRAVRKEEALQD